ncbi:superoxide dismutase [Dongshaea marina]|uniref:superoxide dismutase n=1 Tax=Dongshaea marina TaxID=2047966 RepID=UPI00131F1CEF|nr:superoxide dismutase [Dongshaea marina]
MQILAISKTNEGTTPDKVRPLMEAEVKHTLESYLEGSIRNFWFKVGTRGVVFMLECANEEEAQAKLGELPLVKAGFLDFDLISLQPLTPLGTLIGLEMAP